jgi:hypothetical protein
VRYEYQPESLALGVAFEFGEDKFIMGQHY